MFDIFDLFNESEFFQMPVGYREEVKCPLCGRTYTDFRKTGKLGCSECYKAFSKPLSGVLRQIHHNPVHCGKIPGNLRAKLSVKKQLEKLRSELQDAVRKDDYERAAVLHKEILEIERG